MWSCRMLSYDKFNYTCVHNVPFRYAIEDNMDENVMFIFNTTISESLEKIGPSFNVTLITQQ